MTELPKDILVNELYARQEAYERAEKWEDKEFYPYTDSSGVPTVGVGFNLQDKSTLDLLHKFKQEELEEEGHEGSRAPMSKDDALKESKKFVRNLKKEARHHNGVPSTQVPLLEHMRDTSISMDLNERMLRALIDQKVEWVNKTYEKANLNYMQTAVIADLYYQGGNTYVGKGTNFYKAVQSGDWDEAIYEIQEKSNVKEIEGIQARHDERVADLDIARGGDGNYRASPRPSNRPVGR